MTGQDLERVDRAPEITRLLSTPEGEQRLKLIKQTVAPGCSDAEVGHFLELCYAYELDPFAREVWCAKSRDGQKLLIMVGRDGLRRIAHRNGLGVDGDVVREGDDYSVHRKGDRTRSIDHIYQVVEAIAVAEGKLPPEGFPKRGRGKIIGAWAECYDIKTGEQRGYFYAPLEEYRPENVNKYSPWSKQESVMILAAAERQAIRQATPLGGLLVEGEDDVINGSAVEIGAGEGDGSEPDWQDVAEADVLAIEALLQRAADLDFPGLADRATVKMRLIGQPHEVVARWIEQTRAQLDALEAPDAAGEGVQETLDGGQA